ncbi:MAG: hypothetical protein K1Y36_03830 [Blastocatellia bacterium]|nr:hypothetical protein [Blastocatellia bacterium]
MLLGLLFVLCWSTDITFAQKKTSPEKTKKPVYGFVDVGFEPKAGDLFHTCTRLLPTIDRVVVQEIRENYQTTKEQLADPQFQHFTILAEAELRDAEAEGFAKLWRKLKIANGMGCWTPAFRLTFWSSGQTVPLLKADLCFHCWNLTYSFEGKGEGASFDAQGPTGRKLLEAIANRLKKPEYSPLPNGLYLIQQRESERENLKFDKIEQRVIHFSTYYTEGVDPEPAQFLVVNRLPNVAVRLKVPPKTERDKNGKPLLTFLLPDDQSEALTNFTKSNLGRKLVLVVDEQATIIQPIQKVITNGKIQFRCTDFACARLAFSLEHDK